MFLEHYSSKHTAGTDLCEGAAADFALELPHTAAELLVISPIVAALSEEDAVELVSDDFGESWAKGAVAHERVLSEQAHESIVGTLHDLQQDAMMVDLHQRWHVLCSLARAVYAATMTTKVRCAAKYSCACVHVGCVDLLQSAAAFHPAPSSKVKSTPRFGN